MDTYITDADLGHAEDGLASPIGLPGEGSSSLDFPSARHRQDDGGERSPSHGSFSVRERLGASSSPEADALDTAGVLDPVAQTRRARRNALFAGVAAVVLIGAGGAGFYAFRDNIRTGNLTHGLSTPLSSSTSKPRPVPMEAGVVTHSVVAAAPDKPVHASDAAHATPAFPLDSTATLAREFAALQSFGKPDDATSGALGTDIPTIVPLPSSVKPAQLATPYLPAVQHTPAPIPQEAGVGLQVVQAQPSKSPQAVLSTAPTPLPNVPVTPVISAPLAPASTPIALREPSAIAAELKAGPMTSAQQIEVVGLVKSLGAQLRDTRMEVVQLHQVVAQLSEKVETRTTDFENRLGLAEASAIVQSSARAGVMPPASEVTVSPQPATFTTQPIRLTSARNAVSLPVAPASSPERRTVKDYVVKGASPGLAVLAALNPMAGSGSVIEVGVGDPVPGVGRIRRVYQHGTTWIVETDNGSIQQ